MTFAVQVLEEVFPYSSHWETCHDRIPNREKAERIRQRYVNDKIKARIIEEEQ